MGRGFSRVDFNGFMARLRDMRDDTPWCQLRISGHVCRPYMYDNYPAF